MRSNTLYSYAMKVHAAGAMLLCLAFPLWSQTVVSTLTHPGLLPTAVAVYETGNKVFLADDNDGKIYFYDGATNAELGSTFVGRLVYDMVVDESSGKLYVTSRVAQKIAVLDANTGAFMRYLPGAYRSIVWLDIDESLRKVYALSLEGLTQIDIASDNETPIPGYGGGGFEAMAVNPVTHEVFVTRYIQDVLGIVDGVTLANTTVAGLGALNLGANPAENKVYLTRGGGVGVPFKVYDRDTGVITLIPADNDPTEAFLYNPNSNRMYSDVEVNGFSTIIEGATDSFFNLPMTSTTTALALRVSTNHIYYASKAFTGVLDDASQVLARIPITPYTGPGGILEQAIAINQNTGRVYVINDSRLDSVKVIQDVDQLTRLPVYFGSLGGSGVFAMIPVVDPASRLVVDSWSPQTAFPQHHALATSPGGGRLYFPAPTSFTDALEIYAGAGPGFRARLASFSTGGNDPRAAAFLPDGSRAYVTNSASNNVSVIATATNTVLTTVPVGNRPWGIIMTPEGDRGFVANQNSNTISVFSTATNTVTATIPVGASPWGLAINPGGTKVYVANSGAGTVSVIDVASVTVLRTITVGATPHWLAFAADGKKIFVGNRGSNSVSVIDAGTDQIIVTLTSIANPEGIAALPDHSAVYVVSSNLSGASSCTVIDPSSLAFSSFTLPADARATVSVAIADPSSKFAGRATSASGPINGALVRALQTGGEKAATTTNASGDYALFNLKPGVYDIEVSAAGYVPQSRPAQNAGIGRTTVLHFNLQALCISHGDINNDAALTPGDALCAFQIYLNNGTLPASCDAANSECELTAADVNCDGTTTPGDALAIFTRYLQNLPPQECFARTALPKSPASSYRLTLQQERLEESKLKVALHVENPSGLQAFGLQLKYPFEQFEFLGMRRTSITAEWLQLDAHAASPGVLNIGGYHAQPLVGASSVALFEVAFANKGATSATGFTLSTFVDDLHEAALGASDQELRKLAGVPTQFLLHQNYPNPFHVAQNTVLRFDLPGAEAIGVDLSIFNLNGQLVRRLFTGTYTPGRYEIIWNGKDEQGQEASAGVYWYRLRAGKWSAQKRLVVVR